MLEPAMGMMDLIHISSTKDRTARNGYRYIPSLVSRSSRWSGFDDHFPYRKHNCNKQYVWNWLKLFILYLHVGKCRIQFITFLVTDGG